MGKFVLTKPSKIFRPTATALAKGADVMLRSPSITVPVTTHCG